MRLSLIGVRTFPPTIEICNKLKENLKNSHEICVICKKSLVKIEILRYFALFSTKIYRKKELERYVIDFIISYQEVSK